MAFTILLARRTILLKWKHVSPSTHNSWIREIYVLFTVKEVKVFAEGIIDSIP